MATPPAGDGKKVSRLASPSLPSRDRIDGRGEKGNVNRKPLCTLADDMARGTKTPPGA